MSTIVSVIVPCYNHGQYLSEALDSVLAQTYPSWECIIVNDGSNDVTEMVASVYCEKDERIKYIYQENQGVAVARNNAIHVAAGEYILPLDADDWIDPTYLEKTIRYFGANPNTKLVYSKADTFGCETGLVEIQDYAYESFIWENPIFCYAVFRKSDFEKTSGFNPNMTNGLEDWDFFLSLLHPEDHVHCINEVLFHYRKSENSRSVALTPHVKEMLVQICKNHPDVYRKYVDDIVLVNNQNIRLRRQLEESQNEVRRIRATKAFRLGKWMTTHFPILKLFKSR